MGPKEGQAEENERNGRNGICCFKNGLVPDVKAKLSQIFIGSDIRDPIGMHIKEQTMSEDGLETR